MLQDAQRTSAPRSLRVSIRTAVWMVIWSDPATRAPFSGLAPEYSSRIAMRPGISVSAIAISLRPQAARLRSATSKSVLIGLLTVFMFFLVRPGRFSFGVRELARALQKRSARERYPRAPLPSSTWAGGPCYASLSLVPPFPGNRSAPQRLHYYSSNDTKSAKCPREKGSPNHGPDLFLPPLVNPPNECVEHVVSNLRHREQRYEDDQRRRRGRQIDCSENVGVLAPDEPVPNPFLEVGKGEDGQRIERNIFQLEKAEEPVSVMRDISSLPVLIDPNQGHVRNAVGNDIDERECEIAVKENNPGSPSRGRR